MSVFGVISVICVESDECFLGLSRSFVRRVMSVFWVISVICVESDFWVISVICVENDECFLGYLGHLCEE